MKAKVDNHQKHMLSDVQERNAELEQNNRTCNVVRANRRSIFISPNRLWLNVVKERQLETSHTERRMRQRNACNQMGSVCFRCCPDRDVIQLV